jgi:hypothetical protein
MHIRATRLAWRYGSLLFSVATERLDSMQTEIAAIAVLGLGLASNLVVPQRATNGLEEAKRLGAPRLFLSFGVLAGASEAITRCLRLWPKIPPPSSIRRRPLRLKSGDSPCFGESTPLRMRVSSDDPCTGEKRREAIDTHARGFLLLSRRGGQPRSGSKRRSVAEIASR